MKKFLFICCLSVLCCGCSLIPRITFDSKGTTPQQTEKSLKKIKCKGDILLNEDGTIQSCTRGFISYESNYEKKERKFTIAEKLGNFIRKLTGYGFWIFVALLILCPSALGFIGGRVIEGIFGIGKKALDSTVRAVQKARKNGTDLNEALASEQDSDVKKYIAKLKDEEKIK